MDESENIAKEKKESKKIEIMTPEFDLGDSSSDEDDEVVNLEPESTKLEGEDWYSQLPEENKEEEIVNKSEI